MGMISQYHAKLDSDTIADAIRPLVEADSSIKVKSIIVKVQSRFNYIVSYRKAWLAKQKSVAKAKAYTRSCDEISVEKWVLAFDRGHRWGHTTTTLVECINSVLKGTGNLPVTIIVRSTFYRLNELFTQKSFEAHECVHNKFTRNEMFEVREMRDGSIYNVYLVQRHCDCGHFQVERLPCRHVLACCTNQHLDWQVYVYDVYKMFEICKVYRGEFILMGEPSTWSKYDGTKVITNWTLRRTTKG
ncbi:hypothetical protein Ahy_B06g083279 [Arachis hypogaea]|uniref:SWIM-type domain-containing protein n=1 Tax=Arachis hypogaea TaxID=3818 RepID=A0A444YPQ7_ARAHY|nr:hypothetical protein Ahy_B06g083279 [Arachis hypogaea]